MNWKKLGKIIEINSDNDWLVSHSAVPFVRHLNEDTFRIYFSVRNKANQSQSSYIDYDVKQMKIVNRLTSEPLLKPGIKGNFDDAGVTLSCYCANSDMYYYMGWHIPDDVPFDNQIGAAYQENEKLLRHRSNPVLGKTKKEAYSFGYPWVLFAKGKYFMWYDTNLQWNRKNPRDYKFILRSATSEDGINWTKTYKTNLSLRNNERAIARPCVLFEEEIFKMWYSKDIDGKYTLGYAESTNGIDWTRKDDEVGIATSPDGWDGDEIEYPCVFNHGVDKFMLYNGNGYGKTGIGLAILEG